MSVLKAHGKKMQPVINVLKIMTVRYCSWIVFK